MNMLTRRPSVFDLFGGIDIPYSCEWGWESARPDVDIREEGDRFVLEAELPGFSEKDIDIQVDGSRLTITANRQEDSADKKGERYLLRERQQRTFSRSFELSRAVDIDNIDARFTHGVLQIVAPKKAAEQRKRIAIQAT